MQFETISSISTPVGEGAIAIVRLSGEDAIEIADRLYKGAKTLSDTDSHTINYGHIIDPKTGETVEEVMVALMRAPKTYTREDIVEINCHGGIHTVNRVLQLTLNQRRQNGGTRGIYETRIFKWTGRLITGGSGNGFYPRENESGIKSCEPASAGTLKNLY